MSIFELVNYILLLITLVISCVALGLIIHTKRQVSDTIEPNKPAPPAGGKKEDNQDENEMNQAPELPEKASISNIDAVETHA